MKKLLPALLFFAFAHYAFAQCAPSFTWTQTASNEITFTNTTTPITQDSTFFFWTFGDNTYSLAQDPVHIFSDSGTFYVCLNISDSVLHCSSTFCDSVTTTGSPICNMTVEANSLQNAGCTTCTNGVASEYISAGTPPFTYVWSSGGTHATVGGLSYGWQYLTVTDDNGCTASDSVYIFVGSTISCPTSDFTSHHLHGDTVHFQDWSLSNLPFTTYTWDFGDTTFGTGQTINHHYATADTFTVCLIISDSVFQCTDSYCDTIIIAPPVIIVTGCTPHLLIYTQGDSTAFIWSEDPLNSNLTFVWNWGDNTTDTLPYPTHTYSDTGTFYVCLTVTDSFNQCTDSTCEQLTIHAGHTPFFVSTSQIPLGVTTQEQKNLRVYPNPVKDNLMLNANFPIDNLQVMITDVTGRIVFSGKLNGRELNCEFLETGIYLLQIETPSGRDAAIY